MEGAEEAADVIRVEGESAQRFPGVFQIVHEEEGSKEPL